MVLLKTGYPDRIVASTRSCLPLWPGVDYSIPKVILMQISPYRYFYSETENTVLLKRHIDLSSVCTVYGEFFYRKSLFNGGWKVCLNRQPDLKYQLIKYLTICQPENCVNWQELDVEAYLIWFARFPNYKWQLRLRLYCRKGQFYGHDDNYSCPSYYQMSGQTLLSGQKLQ